MWLARTITTIDAHAGGEPLRIVTSGLPPLAGATMLERRRWMRENLDVVRRILLWEPRGHADMYGAVLTPPVSPDADYGVLFLTNEGYSTMCGHGVIALTTALIETGAVANTVVTYDSPAGLIRARATMADDRVTAVAFENVPAFRLTKGFEIDTSRGTLPVDVCFGGAFYALVDAAALGVEVRRERVAELIALGMEIKHAVEAAIVVRHPDEPELRGIYGTIISDAPHLTGSHGRNVTIFAESEVDRSPCGTGTSAKLANLYADGKIRAGEPYVHESVIDTIFTGKVLGESEVGGLPAVATEISGRGFLTGFHTFVVDPDDPIRDGFLVR
ncbi:MAG: proline racemase family protein [Thermomicrobiales bacterium]